MNQANGRILILLLVIFTLASCQPEEATEAPLEEPGAEGVRIGITPETEGLEDFQLNRNEGVMIEIDGGTTIEIPAGALYEDSQIIVGPSGELPSAFEGSLELLGDPFQLNLDTSDVFASPVTLIISYDPSVLPSDVPEANLFAVSLIQGQWKRVPGEVDEANNTITVHTLHNGHWTWARDTIANFYASDYVEDVRKNPIAIEEARQEVNKRGDEWLARNDQCQYYIEEYKEDLAPWTFIQEKIVLAGSHAAILGLGGKAAVITVGGVAVAHWGGAIAGGLYIGEQIGDVILSGRCLLLDIQAYQRYTEALAVLEMLEHPEQTSFLPEDAETINAFMSQQEIENPNSTSMNWSITSYPDSEVEEIIAALDNEASDTPTPTKTSTPKPQVSEGYITIPGPLQCRSGPDKTHKASYYFNGGEEVKIIAVVSTGGWYLVQRPDNPRESYYCWVAVFAEQVSGDIQSFPEVTPMPTLDLVATQTCKNLKSVGTPCP